MRGKAEGAVYLERLLDAEVGGGLCGGTTRLLSEAFANALERRRLEVSITERLTLERMISSISATFTAVSPVDFDGEVRRELRRIVDAVDIDHGALIELSPDGAPCRTWTLDDGTNPTEFPWMMTPPIFMVRGRPKAHARLC